MPRVELIPLYKGNTVILDETTITTIGRTPQIGCLSNKISRNHAQLFIKSDGTVWIKSIHHNPTFYKTKTNQIVRLTKDKEYQLYNDDQFGLLPDEYFYRISIKSNHENRENHSDQNQTINSSTISKFPIKEKEISTFENDEEEKSESIVDQPRTLPDNIFDSSTSNSTNEKELSQVKTTTTAAVEERTNVTEKNVKEIVYDDDDDEPTSTTASTTEQAGTSNNTDLTTNRPMSSTVVDSTKRERCPYGTTCYRKNLIHRQKASHPGDSDWDSDDDENDNTKPICPYGNECYRTNPDHFNEYHHPKKRSVGNKTKHRSTKRKATDYEDDDSSNESDDEDIVSTDCDIDEEENDDDDDIEWKPQKKSRYLDETDDDSTDDSDKELAKQEAEEFIKGSVVDRHGPVIKKPRVDDE